MDQLNDAALASMIRVSQMDMFHKVPPYGLFRNWLGMRLVERLLAYAESNRHYFKDSEVDGGRGCSPGIDRTERIASSIGLGELQGEIVTRVRGALPSIFETLHVEPFIPTFELELVAHGDGAFFAQHLDTLVHRRRIISAVYYFHALPKAFSGGVLRLESVAASGQQGTFVDIPPDCDTLVFFPSIFPHEVLPIISPSGNFSDSRFAINCWLCQPIGNVHSSRRGHPNNATTRDDGTPCSTQPSL